MQLLPGIRFVSLFAVAVRKIVRNQNEGYIRNIYTLGMMEELREDLTSLKDDHNL